MTGRQVTLRSQRDDDGVRHLSARCTPAGDLVVEGQDLGPAVERYFGPGTTEYEWAHTVRAADVPHLLELLDAPPGADVLDVLAARCTADDAPRLTELLAPTGPVPAEFWSRTGD